MLVVTDTSTQPFPEQTTVVTIGAYDGLHLGHQAVIAQVRAIGISRFVVGPCGDLFGDGPSDGRIGFQQLAGAGVGIEPAGGGSLEEELADGGLAGGNSAGNSDRGHQVRSAAGNE